MSIHSPIFELCEQTGRHFRTCGVCLQRGRTKIKLPSFEFDFLPIFFGSVAWPFFWRPLFNAPFLGAFAMLRKATVSFVMSVRPHGITRLSPVGFSRNLIFGVRKSVEKVQVSLKSGENKGYFT